ncbi:MAG: hypothetical protein WC735_00210 [Candidatus Paceibacterota bacterium]|jgi:hypothetical protein
MKRTLFVSLTVIIILGLGLIIFFHYNKPDLIIENIVTKPPGILDVSIKNIGRQDVVGRVYLCLIDTGSYKNKGKNLQDTPCDHAELVNMDLKGQPGDVLPIKKDETLSFSVYGYSYFGPIYAYIDKSSEVSSTNLVLESNEGNNLFILK